MSSLVKVLIHCVFQGLLSIIVASQIPCFINKLNDSIYAYRTMIKVAIDQYLSHKYEIKILIFLYQIILSGLKLSLQKISNIMYVYYRVNFLVSIR